MMHYMIFKPIIVDGFTVSEEVQRKAVKWMVNRTDPFVAGELMQAARSIGVPLECCYRFTDRMLTKAKKAGLIEYNRGIGFWVRGPNAPEPSDA